MRICTTNCLCNEKGTKRCEENVGICECHHPYRGDSCSECEDDFIFDYETKECLLNTKCAENDGYEDCNGHGSCYEDEKNGLAMCDCDPGFTHDGYDYCGKCMDPLFTYPNCAIRSWILEEPNISCHDLPFKMPRDLHKK